MSVADVLLPIEFEVPCSVAQTPAAVKFPLIDDIPAAVPITDLRRIVELVLAGLNSNPPDSFLGDWDETVREGERLLEEINRRS